MKTLALVAIVLACGCEASLGVGQGGGVDAGGGATQDGNGNGGVDAFVAPDAASACASGRRVYLNFDGVTLTDSATSNSLTNEARWLTNASAAVPPWRQGSGTRATQIQEVVTGVTQRLSATPIEVVTARPAQGPYVMIVFGGARTAEGGTVGTAYSYATSFHDCNDTVKNDVGWVSDMMGISNTSFIADIAVGAIGWGLGLDGTTDPAGCMCGWANGCDSAAGACTLSANIATSITNGNESACTNGTQNEIAAFSTGFCAP